MRVFLNSNLDERGDLGVSVPPDLYAYIIFITQTKFWMLIRVSSFSAFVSVAARGGLATLSHVTTLRHATRSSGCKSSSHLLSSTSAFVTVSANGSRYGICLFFFFGLSK